MQIGYANQLYAIRADIPWRPSHSDTQGIGSQHNSLMSKPTALGSQTAIVVDAQGQSTAQGNDEIVCDRLGRVRIRFHWQGQQDQQSSGNDSANSNSSCWVRVAQRHTGFQFLPRIGQEVLVKFIENDIDQPVIIAALYNGQGEGGQAPTPGGQTAANAATQTTEPKLSIFEPATDHRPSAQGNLTGGGQSVGS